MKTSFKTSRTAAWYAQEKHRRRLAAGPLSFPSVAPVLSGLTSVGATLTSTSGTWSGAPTFQYRFMRDGVYITGYQATNTYIIVVADQSYSVACQVFATTPSGVTSSFSNSIAVP